MNKAIRDRIDIRQGDITKQAADAIVNAANSTLLGGGGVDGAIHRAAGPELLEECRSIGGCPTGEARITKGYRLPAAYVIHTVGPIYSGSPCDLQLLASAYLSCFHLALDHKVHTIAFPAISCGVYGYPIKDAAQIALKTAIDILHAHQEFTQLIFILSSKPNLKIYERVLDLLIG